MPEEQKFLFALLGYLAVEKVLPSDLLERMRADIELHGVTNPENEENDASIKSIQNILR
jgi:hypothetical protein